MPFVYSTVESQIRSGKTSSRIFTHLYSKSRKKITEGYEGHLLTFERDTEEGGVTNGQMGVTLQVPEAKFLVSDGGIYVVDSDIGLSYQPDNIGWGASTTISFQSQLLYIPKSGTKNLTSVPFCVFSPFN
jgi:hypothetical protein